MGKKEKNNEQPQEARLGRLKNGNPPCAIWLLPKCQATAKHSGERCKLPAMKGKKVCYIHGGKSPGAPKGNQNSLKHGRRSRAAIERRQKLQRLIKKARELFDGVK